VLCECSSVRVCMYMQTESATYAVRRTLVCVWSKAAFLPGRSRRRHERAQAQADGDSAEPCALPGQHGTVLDFFRVFTPISLHQALFDVWAASAENGARVLISSISPSRFGGRRSAL
jgi:hypothetical protein